MTGSGRFGEWFAGSKVVDERGDPLVVYLGTGIEKDRFSREGCGAGVGAYFTDDEDVARDYAETDASVDGTDPIVMQVYLSIRNPYESTDSSFFQSISESERDDLEAQGYDGVIGTYQDGSKEYVVFNPWQVKSVDNAGAWSPDSESLNERESMRDRAFWKVVRNR